jgi:hypothetical protein
MERLRQDTGQAEKPGRLQLAIAEWQRQLLANKRGEQGPAIHVKPGTGLRWSAS